MKTLRYLLIGVPLLALMLVSWAMAAALVIGDEMNECLVWLVLALQRRLK